MSLGVIVSITMLLLFFPIFSSNFFYDIGTIMIFSGKTTDIPKGWALCDGSNDTPDLRNRFVVGCWTSDNIPLIEDNNTDKLYVGKGIKQSIMDNPKAIVDEESVLGLIGDNVPYLFGQKYNSKIKEDDYNILDYDHGTNWFKKYAYEDRPSKCKRVMSGSKPVDYTPEYKEYFKESNKIDLCTGIKEPKAPNLSAKDKDKDNNYIMNDSNITANDSTSMLRNYDKEPIEYDFNYYCDTNNPEEMSIFPKKISNPKSAETNNVRQIPVKRRIFRDYEDYKLYHEIGKNIGVSCYDCLPMNHKFDHHYYGHNTRYEPIKLIDDATENLNLVTVNNEVRFKQFMKDFMYEKPYSNNPSFFKLAYIMRVH